MNFKKPTREEVLVEAKDTVFVTIGIMLYSLGWAAFLLPYEITTGGAAGISAIVYYATGFPIQWTNLIVNALLMVGAVMTLGPKFCIKTIYSIFTMTFFLWLMQYLVNSTNGGVAPQILGEGQEFMACIIGGGMCGIGLGIVFNANSSTGGTDIIAAIIHKYKDVTLGRMVMAADVCIICSGYFILPHESHGIKSILFGLVTLFSLGMMIDYVVNTSRSSVQFFIFSKKYKEIADVIIAETGRSVTVIDGEGWYKKSDVKVMILLTYRRQSVEIFRIIKEIDPDAFIAQSSVIGVYGQGFDKIKVSTKRKQKESFAKG